MEETIFSLALDTFGLGMAGFGIMGVLLDVAHDVGASIPTAGNIIVQYTFGMVTGVPIMALPSGRFSSKSVMLFPAALCILGNTLFTLSSSYTILALGHLISGFPHRAFFGVGTITLSKITPPGKATTAAAGIIGRMTVTNLVGVPGGTWPGYRFNWYYTFTLTAVFDVVVLMTIFCWVPTLYDRIGTRLCEQFRLLASSAPWPVLAATMFNSADMSARFNYIKLFMTDVSGSAKNGVMLVMMLTGLGMIVGSLFSGKISRRFSPLRITATTSGVIAVTLLLIFAFGEHKVASLTLVLIYYAGLFALLAPLQILLLQNVKGDEMLRAAGGQTIFNFGSAISAFCGEMMIVQGFGWNSVALPVTTLSFLAMSTLLICGYHQRR